MKHPLLTYLKNTKQPQVITLTDQLPQQIQAPCTLQCCWTLTPQDNALHLTLKVEGTLQILCQRCCEMFEHHFQQENTLILFETEAALKLANKAQDTLLIDELPDQLEALLMDELHLYAPEKHQSDTYGSGADTGIQECKFNIAPS